MRKILLAILILLFTGSVGFAETYTFPDQKDSRKIEVKQEKDFLEVTVYPKGRTPVICRVYPCGKIEKMEWKEVAPNVEQSGTLYYHAQPNFIYNNSTLELKTLEQKIR